MRFRFRHDQLCCLIRRAVFAIPVDDDAVNSATDHIFDLMVYLRSIGRVVANIHVVRAPEPNQEVSVDLGGRARIKQRMDVNFADISRAKISIRLGRKIVGCAGVICGE